ncbi:conjugal transfer protein TraN [Aliarcobacter lanthieri]|uniref:conjugal transfer protein TraN n=1 Tax=Aliarcobacter lanthieri TaxID=1355374 RepID=UPI000B1F60B3|nr:conjugal transfer protein TraN [Aliarcobacter lanthieri]QKF59201.1 F-type type IV conjugative transfer system protein TraN [Aliarcobacter lanthieri]
MFKKIGLIFFGLVTLINASSKCPDIQDLKQHNGHYYGITTNTMTFDEAKKFAESKGGYIAIPNNAAENTFLKSILGGRKGGWIGVYDPSYSASYSYSVGQKKNSSRFRDIKGNALSYSYWESSQPDNLVEEYDTYNGQQRVSPLGEHWVAMDGNSGRWWDYGNHFGIGNAKYYVLLEFDSVPTCFEDLSSNVTDTFTNKKCSTQIWDNKTGNLETGTIFDCRTDSYGNTYCPSALSQCGQEWDYDNGFSVAGVGQVVDYTDKEVHIEIVPANCNCGYYFSCQYGFLYNHFFTKTRAESESYFLQCVAQGGFGLNVGFYQCADGVEPKTIGMTTQNIQIPTDMSCKTEIATKKCSPGYTETTSSETSKGECKKTIEYTYYNYLCNNSKNEQGYNYTPINSGGNCNKIDSNNTTANPELTNPCNNSTPPVNNCKREKFMCQANKDRPCSFVDNSWQCSPFPCFGGNDIVPEGDVEGANDKNNDGWNENGMCDGQIYIFNGKDRRCRSSDTFFGLAGGGCCDKDKVFMGLIECKENEKLLAKQNKAELCTEIGEYCSKKINLGFAKICVQKSKGHCCFGSKLARFVHEQGRSQIGIEWGSPESPQCRGFTPEEFQKLDFSKIDLTGAFDMPEINQTDLTNKINNTVENFKNMVSSGNN